MSNPKGSALPDLISIYLVMWILYGLDVLFLKSDLTVLGSNFYAYFLCFTILAMLVLFKKERIQSFGISKKKASFKSAAIFGILFSVVPLALVWIAEIAVAKAFAPYAINICFRTPNIDFVESNQLLTTGGCIAIYFFTTLFEVCFKEMYFRGLILHKLKKLTTFKKANLFQAMLSAVFITPLFLRTSGDDFDTNFFGFYALVVLFALVFEFVASVKWGILRTAGGSAYISIVDHFVFLFLVNSLSIAGQGSEWILMLTMTASQIISLVPVFFYGKKHIEKEEPEPVEERKKFKLKKEEKAVKEEEKIIPEELKQTGYTADMIPDSEEISPEQFKDIVREADTSDNDSNPGDDEFGEEDIDDFLKSFGKPQHHYNPPQEVKPKETEIDENFDVDDFLKDFTDTNKNKE